MKSIIGTVPGLIIIGGVILICVVIIGSLIGWPHKKAVSTCANPTIKGNISFTTGEKIYHLPSDRFYSRTIIDTSAGERMFCTTEEAQAAGWRASGQ